MNYKNSRFFIYINAIFFHSLIDKVFMYSVFKVKSHAIQSLVSQLRVFIRSSNILLFLYGVSINICD